MADFPGGPVKLSPGTTTEHMCCKEKSRPSEEPTLQPEQPLLLPPQLEKAAFSNQDPPQPEIN